VPGPERGLARVPALALEREMAQGSVRVQVQVTALVPEMARVPVRAPEKVRAQALEPAKAHRTPVAAPVRWRFPRLSRRRH
jgi:hypothetical protein